MFDNYRIQHGPSHVSKTVHEHRAPTDTSVALLREMESKARDQVVQAMRIESAGVEAIVHRVDDPMQGRTLYAIHYKVNDHPRRCETETDWQARIEDRLHEVWKCVAEDLASFLISQHVKAVHGR